MPLSLYCGAIATEVKTLGHILLIIGLIVIVLLGLHWVLMRFYLCSTGPRKADRLLHFPPTQYDQSSRKHEQQTSSTVELSSKH
ncbi:uncharacterized protein BO88DRAFT_119157 [Aspergillus vadensis CBS 113365]|uniref:Uncharacterized protein n=1 Tax=Aspergillus vadensis (strain CBS 113365 / IMI 142717 / IBT 24658) TaxID=1448311 RepID=A0A319B2H4_ASPVC|nr:hypothetical protein BO88DRAFT_119157 [Aspergillus vadensis CBS 113365]PYH66445.1 hypothetical protein BO88DRAFT_119157 [Aspergillus vadensis CBS 113365]